MADKSNSTFILKEASIYSQKTGEKQSLMGGALITFAYFEDIQRHFVHGRAEIVDSGKNIYGNLPIQGGERVDIKIVDALEAEFNYSFYVYKISSRKFNDNMQAYTLSLISKEGIYNEGVRVSKLLEGPPDQIVSQLLTEYLGVDPNQKKILTQPCSALVKFFPDGKKCHTIISQLAPKSIPQLSPPKSTGTLPEKGGEAEVANDTAKTSIPKDTKKTKGSSGYFFFENYEGFNFKSIDYYFSDGSDEFEGVKPVDTYTVRPAGATEGPGTGVISRNVIEEYSFTNEIDILGQLRDGVYSTYLVFYNYSTGQYEEYTHTMHDSFKSQAHLGSQEELGTFQQKLSERPSRIISTILDHETWYNEKKTGSNEESDGGDGDNSFPDYQKFYMAQSLARYNNIAHQKLVIVVPGNPNLKVGDKLNIILPNMVSTEERKSEPVDTENSGLYLISKIGHNFNVLNTSTKTIIELIRDTSGMKEFGSKVG